MHVSFSFCGTRAIFSVFFLLLVGCGMICEAIMGRSLGVEGVRCSVLGIVGWFRRAVVVCCVLVPLVQNDRGRGS